MSFRIKYFIPEDGDEFDHPNIFSLNTNGGGSPTLIEVRRSFPVPGSYHFRFLRTLNDTKVWIDLTNENDVVPIFDGQIIAKVSRLSVPTHTNKTVSTSRPVVAAQTAPTKVSAAPEPTKSGPPKVVKTASLIDDQEEDLFGLSSNNNGPSSQNSAHNTSSDLLGFSSPASPVAQTASNPDLFGLDSFVPSAPVKQQQTSSATATPSIQLQRSANSNGQTNQAFGAPQAGIGMSMRGGPMGQMGGPMGNGMQQQQPTRGLSQQSTTVNGRGMNEGASSKNGINIDPFGSLGGTKK